MFKKLRILILFLILATVALSAWRANQRLTAWEHTIHIGIYPIAGDQSPTTTQFVREFNEDSTRSITEWIEQEAEKYKITVLQPVSFRVAPVLSKLPPLPPNHASAIDAMLWSMKIRWWAWHNDKISGPKPNIRLFVIFHDGNLTPSLAHSVGLGKGQIAVIHAFANRSQRRQNAVVITHELLHTFGATDKYNLSNLQPIYPQGYAEPDRSPHLPQRYAEIMAGRTPVSETAANIPAGLDETIVGADTASEIGWIKRSR